jgi:hypothetical protein
MMATPSESPLKQAQAYRAARRAFIAACEKAHVDSIARLNPARGADGKPLFMDAAALGPRHAAKAVLVIARRAEGAAVITELLRAGLTPPGQTRVVLVHALEPAAFAGAEATPGWPLAMLGAVATEDLSRVRELGVLPLEDGPDLTESLSNSLPKARITVLAVAATPVLARDAINAFLAG